MAGEDGSVRFAAKTMRVTSLSSGAAVSTMFVSSMLVEQGRELERLFNLNGDVRELYREDGEAHCYHP